MDRKDKKVQKEMNRMTKRKLTAMLIGYAGLYETRKNLEEKGYTTILVDDGDNIQGEALGTLTKGQISMDLMNEMAYDVAIPGNHEFDYGMDRLMFKHGDGQTAFDGATIISSEICIDNVAVTEFIVNELGGTIGEEYADPYGQGRITITQ